MKKILTLAVFLSVSAHATEIDNLLNASGSIRDTFDLGIQTVGGQYAYGRRRIDLQLSECLNQKYHE